MTKKNIIWLYPLILMGSIIMLTNSCAKDDNIDPAETVTDIDGNVYHTVTIGTQVWMVENLKTTKYRDGTNIPNVTDNKEWPDLTTGAYGDYDNTPSNSVVYGRLYNWYAATDARNIAPTGWHIPTDDEWTTLATYLGGESVAGDKLKEIGNTHWESENAGATNETGFTALPGGHRTNNGGFLQIGRYAFWWSTTEHPLLNTTSHYHYVDLASSYKTRSNQIKWWGLSLRCIKD
jgi:uncharacterized protein (TIGR02145 family)